MLLLPPVNPAYLSPPPSLNRFLFAIPSQRLNACVERRPFIGVSMVKSVLHGFSLAHQAVELAGMMPFHLRAAWSLARALLIKVVSSGFWLKVSVSFVSYSRAALSCLACSFNASSVRSSLSPLRAIALAFSRCLWTCFWTCLYFKSKIHAAIFLTSWANQPIISNRISKTHERMCNCRGSF